MGSGRPTRHIRLSAIAIVLLSLPGVLRANLIGLEWRPAVQTSQVGTTVGVGLYAVSLTGQPEEFDSAQVIILWDPAELTLLELDQQDAVLQPPDDLSAFIPGDSWGLNEASPPADGDGIWQGLVELGASRLATVEGSLLTTIVFQALQETTCAEVTMIATIQKPGFGPAWSKVVQSNDHGSYNVLDYSTLPATACIDITDDVIVPGDCDGDGQIDYDDLLYFGSCMYGPQLPYDVDCACADIDTDADVDLADFATLQLGLGQ